MRATNKSMTKLNRENLESVLKDYEKIKRRIAPYIKPRKTLTPIKPTK